ISIAPPSFLAVASSFVFLLVLIFGVGLLFIGGQKYAAEIQWDKIGTGTQNVRVIDVDNSANVLFDVAVVSGNNVVALTTLPVFATGTKLLKLQAKSTTAADDPVFRGCSIRLK
ncbi:MAG: hypothetical protein AABY22_18100, partial [Nanoarchaeota archaeon]